MTNFGDIRSEYGEAVGLIGESLAELSTVEETSEQAMNLAEQVANGAGKQVAATEKLADQPYPGPNVRYSQSLAEGSSERSGAAASRLSSPHSEIGRGQEELAAKGLSVARHVIDWVGRQGDFGAAQNEALAAELKQVEELADMILAGVASQGAELLELMRDIRAVQDSLEDKQRRV